MNEPKAFPETAEQLQSARKSMRRYRRIHRRIDYYPSAEAAKEIDRLRATNPQRCLGEILDYAVTTFCNPVSGNERK